jgi:chaperone LolA
MLCAAASVAFAESRELTGSETATLIAELQEHRTRFPSVTAEFAEQKTSRLLQKPIATSGTIAFTAPNLLRREIKGANPSVTVCDGKQLWIYYPNFNEAEHYKLGEHAFFDDSLAALTAGLNFQNIAKYYRFDAFRETEGYRLVLHPRTSGLKRLLRELTVWITESYLIARTEALLPKDDKVITTYRKQRSRPVPAAEFEFQPPAEARVSSPLGK